MKILSLFSLDLCKIDNDKTFNTMKTVDANFKITKSLLDRYRGTHIQTKGEINITKERFIKMYFSCIDNICNLTDTEVRVLIYVCGFSTFNFDVDNRGNMFQNSKLFKEYCVARGCTLSSRTIDNCISSLAKKECLLFVMKGIYIVNPIYLLKGHMTDDMRYKVYFEITGNNSNGIMDITNLSNDFIVDFENDKTIK